MRLSLGLILYDLAIFLFRGALCLASPFVPKAKKMMNGRRHLRKKLEVLEKLDKKRTILFHTASFGEFEQARPLIERFREVFPEFRIILTFFSSSGFEAVPEYSFVDQILYLPFDTRNKTRRFVSAINPEIAIVVKYEFWYHFFDSLYNNDTKILSVSAIFRPDQIFFKSYGGVHRSILKRVYHFYLQNEDSLELLRGLGYENATVSGDTRFDRVLELSHQDDHQERIVKFKGAHKLMIVGSSWPEDMNELLPVIHDGGIAMKYIIAPHEISESGVKKLMHQLDNDCYRYSSWDGSNPEKHRVLIIDSIGLLSRLYRYGIMAYIGGAFGSGLHNILEAAVCGIPVFFGKSRGNRKFQEAVDLVRLGGAFEIRNSKELKSKIRELLDDDNARKQVGEINKDYLRRGSGAAARIMEGINKILC